ncbi:hypothetical protein P3T24_006604 [Paraburkholderia sp. GAS33]|uniref:PIN domain-containing protein n=1 Tax=Paraburkholderia sp. GAS33 TaxID=3035130 RepID=UPI003D192E3D
MILKMREFLQQAVARAAQQGGSVEQEPIEEKARRGGYGAIVIDTSIFDQYQLELESGLLRRVEQFADGSVKVLMPDVTRRELENHLIGKAEEAQTGLKRALRLSQRAGLINGIEAQCDAIAAQATTEAAQSASRARLATWIQRTGARVIDCGRHVDVTTLMDHYFEARAPFAATGDKKNEFPDAVTLLALKDWSEANGTDVLAVSRDSDWKRFATLTDRIHVVENLADALMAFQHHTTLYACKLLAESLDQGDPHGIRSAIEAAVSSQLINALQIETLGSAGDRLWIKDRMEVMPLGVRFAEGPLEMRFSAVLRNDKMLVTQVRLIVGLRFSVASRILERDGGPGEVWPVVITRKKDVALDATVTFHGRSPDQMRVNDVEILPASYTLDLGDVTRA